MKPDVLVVDDDPDARAILGTILSRAGWRVRYAENGLEALTEIERQLPQLIITDLMMPVMDGIEFMRRLRQQPRCTAIPVIVSSAVSMPEAVHLGGTAVVSKGAGLVRDLMQTLQTIPTPDLSLDPRGH